MFGFTERIQRLKELIDNINARFASTVESDPISQIKRKMVDVGLPQIDIKSIHRGQARAVIKFSNSSSLTIYIDDLLDQDVNELNYRLTSIDLKRKSIEMLGMVYQSNGIVRIEKIAIQYSPNLRQYVIKIKSSQSFTKGRLFIPIKLTLDLNDYQENPVDLQPLPQNMNDKHRPEGACRPNSLHRSSGQVSISTNNGSGVISLI